MNYNKLANLSTVKFSVAIITVVVILTGLVACSKSPTIESNQKNWLQSGQITLSKAAPQPSTPRSLNMLGFVPITGSHIGVWLSVDTRSKKIELMDGNRVLASSLIEDAEAISPGNYQILHMQKDALWYAPDSYFIKRNLAVPGQGDKQRFRRGALGEYAIFINKDTPIHSGPVNAEEIGGIRVKESDLSKIFYQLQIGSVIDVR